jgi:hypothetical protein
MIRYILRALSLRVSKPQEITEFTEDELEAMWDDDTVDIKNFSRMDPGPSKDEFREMLEYRMKWYERVRLYDWAEQIDVALWLDSKGPA